MAVAETVRTCRLCGDCQRSCKQLAEAVVVSCPLYVRIPRQAEIPLAGGPHEKTARALGRSRKGE